MSASVGGAATPTIGSGGQAGGELFKGFSALGNRVSGSVFFLKKKLASSPYDWLYSSQIV
jgi:hypothetical protein